MHPWLNSTYRYLTTDPSVLGVLSWLGLIISLVGFCVAIWQIRKTLSAAEAATAASNQLVRVVRGREQLVEMTSTIAHINRAKDALTTAQFSVAALHLELASTSTANVLQLIDATHRDTRELKKALVRLQKLSEAVHSVPAAEHTDKMVELALQAREVSEMLKAPAARLRYEYDLKDNPNHGTG